MVGIPQAGLKASKLELGIVAGMSLAALGLRLAFFGQPNADMQQYLDWYNFIASHGGWRALAESFSNYTPPYTYFLALLTYLPFIPAAIGIKLIAVIFDFGMGLTLARIIRRRAGELAGWKIYLVVLFSPAVFFLSGVWGQADGIYTFFLALSVLSLLEEKTGRGIAFVSIAFAFKAQAAFLGVLILALVIIRFKWKYRLIPPGVFLGMMIPALAAGRSLESILMVYPNQGTTFGGLALNAPSLYAFFSNDLYGVLVPVGVGLAALAGLSLAGVTVLRRRRLDEGGLVLLAVLSLFSLPFLLPKMHERYFYPAAVLAWLLPFYFPRLWPVPAVLQVTSLLSYLPFVFGYGLLDIPVLAVLNLAAVTGLLVFYLHYLFQPQPAQVDEAA